MTDEFYSGNWEGNYSYGAEYSEGRRKIKVGFHIKMILQDGVLSGTCEELLITKVHMGRPAVLSGVIDGHHINFTKQYAYFFEFNEFGDMEFDKSRPSHTIHYTGIFHPITGVFSGNWKIEDLSEEDRGSADFFSGSWEMWKVGQ